MACNVGAKAKGLLVMKRHVTLDSSEQLEEAETVEGVLSCAGFQ